MFLVQIIAHYVMMGVADARGLAVGVDTRRKDERPRTEIQPVGKGRQRQVVAVQHGNTLASACVQAGLRVEALNFRGAETKRSLNGNQDGSWPSWSRYRVIGLAKARVISMRPGTRPDVGFMEERLDLRRRDEEDREPVPPRIGDDSESSS